MEPVVWTTLGTTCGRCHSRVGIPGRPPYVIPHGSAGWKKKVCISSTWPDQDSVPINAIGKPIERKANRAERISIWKCIRSLKPSNVELGFCLNWKNSHLIKALFECCCCGIDTKKGRSGLANWKYHHWSPATLSCVSTWFKCCQSAAANHYNQLDLTGWWLCVEES